MALVDYKTTHWMRIVHPDVKKFTTAEFLELNKPIKSIQLYPNDIVVIDVNDDSRFRFDPAMLTLYKHLWDNVGDTDKKLIHKHIKRCIHIRNQFKKKLCPEDVRIWYMSLVLGAIDV